MRQLTTLPSADSAQTLADYLLTLHIHTKVEKEPKGWAIWVRDEDQLPRARQELDEFQRNPHDPRYTAASSAANALRRQQNQEEKAYHRRQKRIYSRMGAASAAGKCTIALIVACVLVMLLSDTSRSNSVRQALFIAPSQYVLVRLDSSRPTSEDDEESYKVEFRSEGLQPLLHGEIWRLVTPIFLHFNIWHLVFNMYWLYALGGAIERKRGWLRYLSLVLVLAVFSNLTQYFFGHVVWEGFVPHPVPQPMFGGMSGVVYGLFGYIWMKARFQPELGLSIDPANVIIMMALFFLCMTPVIHFLTGSDVANGAHAGGLIAGMLIGYVPTMWRSSPSD